MFGIFKTKEEKNPDWIDTINETQTRWFVFLGKLEEKMEELCEASIPELKELASTDKDTFKRTYYSVLMGVKGQLENIRRKSYDAYVEKILDLYDDIKADVSVMSPHHSLLTKFRSECGYRYYKIFDEKHNEWLRKLDETNVEDLEAKYQTILNEYESIKDKFSCKQCGGKITIDKIFYITTYIACSHCQTQNTFEPSTTARSLEFLARQLAEQRTQALLNAYNIELARERDLYQYGHQKRLSYNHNTDKKTVEKIKIEEIEIENQRIQAIKNANTLYEKYLRAMFDEWSNIIPALKEHNEKFYQTQLTEFRNRTQKI